MTSEHMRKTLRISYYMIIIMMVIILAFMIPKLHFVVQLYECFLIESCILERKN